MFGGRGVGRKISDNICKILENGVVKLNDGPIFSLGRRRGKGEEI